MEAGPTLRGQKAFRGLNIPAFILAKGLATDETTKLWICSVPKREMTNYQAVVLAGAACLPGAYPSKLLIWLNLERAKGIEPPTYSLGSDHTPLN